MNKKTNLLLPVDKTVVMDGSSTLMHPLNAFQYITTPQKGCVNCKWFVSLGKYCGNKENSFYEIILPELTAEQIAKRTDKFKSWWCREYIEKYE